MNEREIFEPPVDESSRFGHSSGRRPKRVCEKARCWAFALLSWDVWGAGEGPWQVPWGGGKSTRRRMTKLESWFIIDSLSISIKNKSFKKSLACRSFPFLYIFYFFFPFPNDLSSRNQCNSNLLTDEAGTESPMVTDRRWWWCKIYIKKKQKIKTTGETEA